MVLARTVRNERARSFPLYACISITSWKRLLYPRGERRQGCASAHMELPWSLMFYRGLGVCVVAGGLFSGTLPAQSKRPFVFGEVRRSTGRSSAAAVFHDLDFDRRMRRPGGHPTAH